MRASDAGGSVHEVLVERLGAAIVHGEHAPGARLITAELGSDSGASRSAAREAVRVLESLGLVRVRRRSGVEVRPASEWNVYAPEVIRWRLGGPDRLRQLHELSQLRGAIEPLAARLAASEASEEQRRELTEAVAQMRRNAHAADQQAYLDADIRFHRTLLAASGNPMLAALDEVVASVLVGRTQHALMPHDADSEAVRLHRDVAFAVAGGDGDAAATAMAQIVSEADLAVQVMGEVGDPTRVG
ncbi:FadR/GntR family transcriptional regulator [Microbacterium sp. SORGH_AS_0888]|uniref:FadR/GntR family transcriptional regulator n=1 Tax=Microbacterium sp. SORGH_AS_0888 TaxID=3041791 RepID=UPI0027D8D798|nr:FCD domain-containing protein [Microbacterium sp. SORGH_AS_0888]